MVSKPIEISLGDWGGIVKELQRLADGQDDMKEKFAHHIDADESMRQDVAEIKAHLLKEKTVSNYKKTSAAEVAKRVGIIGGILVVLLDVVRWIWPMATKVK